MTHLFALNNDMKLKYIFEEHIMISDFVDVIGAFLLKRFPYFNKTYIDKKVVALVANTL